jgi:hypothetical protein
MVRLFLSFILSLINWGRFASFLRVGWELVEQQGGQLGWPVGDALGEVEEFSPKVIKVL